MTTVAEETQQDPREALAKLVCGLCLCEHDLGFHHVDTGCAWTDGWNRCACDRNLPEATADAILASPVWQNLADQAQRLREARRLIRSAYLDVVRDRDRTAQDTTLEGRARAVTHQTHASRMLRLHDALTYGDGQSGGEPS